jgi:hypothetical protein
MERFMTPSIETIIIGDDEGENDSEKEKTANDEVNDGPPILIPNSQVEFPTAQL